MLAASPGLRSVVSAMNLIEREGAVVFLGLLESRWNRLELCAGAEGEKRGDESCRHLGAMWFQGQELVFFPKCSLRMRQMLG